MRVIPLLSTDDTRVIVWTTLELSLNRQIEKYREKEKTESARSAHGKRGFSRVLQELRPDLTCLLPAVNRPFVYLHSRVAAGARSARGGPSARYGKTFTVCEGA